MKVCLAGISSTSIPTRKEVKKIKFMLESFYSFSDWELEEIKTKELFLLDSGAFTFMNGFKGVIDWQEYIDKYANFIVKNNIKYFFELDIDVLVGHEKVKQYRKYLEKKVGRKCIPVWHKSRGLDEWKKLTKEYDYVAIGGIVTKEIKPKEYKFFTPLLEIARKNKCKVHGLGFTNLKSLKKYKFYSVDSTSWKSGNRFGILYKFNGTTLVQVKKEKNQKMINPCYLGDNHNLNEWIKFQKYADKYL